MSLTDQLDDVADSISDYLSGTEEEDVRELAESACLLHIALENLMAQLETTLTNQQTGENQ